MKELIIVCIIALIITAGLNHILGIKEDEELPAKLFIVAQKITAKSGAVGCLSKESYIEYINFSAKQKNAEIENLIARGLCVYFAKDRELMVTQEGCSEMKEGNLFPSIPKGSSSIFYMPCSVIR